MLLRRVVSDWRISPSGTRMAISGSSWARRMMSSSRPGTLIGPFDGRERSYGASGRRRAPVAIGKPDPTAGEIVKAFVALKPGHEPSEALAQKGTPRPCP